MPFDLLFPLSYTARRVCRKIAIKMYAQRMSRAPSMVKEKEKKLNLLMLGVGTILTSMVISGLILGFIVDWWLGTTPIFMMSFLLIGFIGGMLKVYKMLTHPEMF